jgi:hypothetical protein
MKIFLYTDIDGVLSPSIDKFHINSKWGWIYNFDSKTVKIYNEILSSFDCEIIISSDWKYHHSLSDLGEIFEYYGVIKKPFDTTPHFTYKTYQHLEEDRAKEILIHVKENNPDIWLSIDDYNLSKWINNENFVQIHNPSIGLTNLNKEEIFNKLNKYF